MAAARARSESFSNVDAAWLHMEEPTSMAMITSVMMFDRPIDFRRLKATLEHRMLTYDRFRQRVKEPSLHLGLPRWEFDPHFNIYAHLHRVALPEPGDQDALQTLVGDLMSTPLDFTKPLWQTHLVENFGQGCAVVTRLHHCIADGLALMQVLLAMTDDDSDAPWPEAPAEEHHKSSRVDWLLRPVTRTYRLANKTMRMAESLLHEGFDTLTHPSKAMDVARLSASGGRALAKLVLIPPDQKTIFKGKCGVEKRAAWSQPIPLSEVKAIGQSLGGTINDVLLAAVSGALRRYLESNGQPTDGVEIRAIVPVNLRGENETEKLGNRFGLVFLTLPVGLRNPIKRLVVLKKRMDQIKNTPEAVVAFGILAAIGMTPTQIQDIIVQIFAMKGTAVMTNVPGPRQRRYMAGAPIQGMMFWVPAPGELGMGVSIFSYAGEVIVGINTDACMVPDPDAIIESYHDELDAMKNWGSRPARERREAAAPAGAEPGTEIPVEESPGPSAEAATARGESLALFEQARRLEAEAAALEAQIAELEQRAAQRQAEALVAAVAEATTPATPGENGRCQAVTRSGAPCKNRALAGSSLCRIHSS